MDRSLFFSFSLWFMVSSQQNAVPVDFFYFYIPTLIYLKETRLYFSQPRSFYLPSILLFYNQSEGIDYRKNKWYETYNVLLEVADWLVTCNT